VVGPWDGGGGGGGGGPGGLEESPWRRQNPRRLVRWVGFGFRGRAVETAAARGG
jgi:hypothetical protein